MTDRRLAAVVAVALLTVGCARLTVQADGGPTLPDGRPASIWTEWPNHIVIDGDCADDVCWQNGADPVWWFWHEVGHTLYWGVDAVENERRAMAFAAAVMGRPPHGFAPSAAEIEAGYELPW